MEFPPNPAVQYCALPSCSHVFLRAPLGAVANPVVVDGRLEAQRQEEEEQQREAERIAEVPGPRHSGDRDRVKVKRGPLKLNPEYIQLETITVFKGEVHSTGHSIRNSDSKVDRIYTY